MDRETLIKMDPDKYKEYLYNAIYDDIQTSLNLSKGHSETLHSGMSDEEMIQRIVLEDKNNITTFQNETVMYDYMSNSMDYKLNDIVNWFTSGRIDFKNPKDFQEFAFEVDMSPEIVGLVLLKI